MKANRRRKLKEKQWDLEKSLKKWADRTGLLASSERLIVSLRIVNEKKKKYTPKPRTIFYEKAAFEIPLPPDAIPKSQIDSCSIWHLVEEDWEKLNRLPWNKHQAVVFSELRTHNNGPIHVSDFNSAGSNLGPTLSSFVTAFNRILDAIADYHQYKLGSCYYALTQIEGRYRHYYAIRKQQFVAGPELKPVS